MLYLPSKYIVNDAGLKKIVAVHCGWWKWSFGPKTALPYYNSINNSLPIPHILIYTNSVPFTSYTNHTLCHMVLGECYKLPDCMVKMMNEAVRIHVASSHLLTSFSSTMTVTLPPNWDVVTGISVVMLVIFYQQSLQPLSRLWTGSLSCGLTLSVMDCFPQLWTDSLSYGLVPLVVD